MEKLIELLNEYNKEITNGEIWWKEWKYDEEFWNLLCWDYNWWTFSEMYCISKKFWFIKWLVENDKINFYKWKFLEYPIWSNNYDECDYLDLIQWLAISDTPIDDLIYYLK